MTEPLKKFKMNHIRVIYIRTINYFLPGLNCVEP